MLVQCSGIQGGRYGSLTFVSLMGQVAQMSSFEHSNANVMDHTSIQRL